MKERPYLDKNIDANTFRSFYYLKEEMLDFCRKHGLPTTGGKIEIADRIAHYLQSGEIISAQKKTKVKPAIREITESMLIEPNFVCSEKHRAFFKAKIGKTFSFNVAFQKWLKGNTGKTYGEAIDAYYQILEEKKKGKTTIDRQFEYNTYIRDFFGDNKGKTLKDAIKCWEYKKRQQGHNHYERADLKVLNEIF